MLSSKISSKRASMIAAAFAFLAPASFLLSIPWLKAQQSEALVYLCAGIAATITIAASFVMAIIGDRKMDEWHRSAARFAQQWGWISGAGLIALLLALPPVQDLIFALTSGLNDGQTVDREAAIITFVAGFMAVVVAQSICTMVLSAVWRARMSRPE